MAGLTWAAKIVGIADTVSKLETNAASTEDHGTEIHNSWASSPGVRKSMVSNRGHDTHLETTLRSALHRQGLRFRVHRRPLAQVRCEVDIVFPSQHVAVFVNGCFWHGCPEHATWPMTNREFWATKINGNIERDQRHDTLLEAAGWKVLRLWEHQTIPQMVDSVRAALIDAADNQAD